MRRRVVMLLAVVLPLLIPPFSARASAAPRRVAILEFRNISNDKEFSWLSEAVPEDLTTRLAKIRALSLIERRQIGKVMKEQRFQLSDLADPSTTAKIGKLAGAQVVVLGSFIRFGEDLRFNLRFVDVETGVVLDTAQVQAKTSSGTALFAGLNRLADAAIEALEKRVVVKGPTKEVVRTARLPVTPEERKRIHAPPAKSLAAYALYGKALEERKKGRWREAAALLERATEKDKTFAGAFNLLGVVQLDLGRMDPAKEAYARALALFRERGNERGVADALNNMGIIHEKQGRYAEAMRLYKESLAIDRRLGNEANIAKVLNNMGEIHRRQDRYGEAMRLYKESLAISRRLGNEAPVAATLSNMGNIHLLKDRYDEATRLYRESLGINRRLGNEAGMAATLNNMGEIHRQQDRYDEAMKLYRESLGINRRLGNEVGVAETLGNMGLVRGNQGRLREARGLLCDGLSISQRLGLAPYVKYFKRLIGIIQKQRPSLSCAR